MLAESEEFLFLACCVSFFLDPYLFSSSLLGLATLSELWHARLRLPSLTLISSCHGAGPDFSILGHAQHLVLSDFNIRIITAFCPSPLELY